MSAKYTNTEQKKHLLFSIDDYSDYFLKNFNFKFRLVAI